ncbi:unnamed protein product [Rotaria socialis]|uniref:Uncharacterized protein n=1 Tax=Rotaria socialis TaxID=392032 RepID=A0A817VAE3_9BILA|nr:unnamed protein product [Rotaria socialis]CAF3458712.1 unnamed protein product [Rotaria socialis]CAF3462574.1 unnamed protein product [Rotaria socialis]CAF3615792.1 unnamed protein product [Rotaria socialis]CAF3623768.1 unnamed protein product [Rotaria socialis]
MQRRGNTMPTFDQLRSAEDYFPLFLEQTLQIYALRMKENEDQVDTVADRLSDREVLVDSVHIFQNCNIALLGGNNDECIAVSHIYPYGPGTFKRKVLFLIY